MKNNFKKFAVAIAAIVGANNDNKFCSYCTTIH